jgi:hypothetical protein
MHNEHATTPPATPPTTDATPKPAIRCSRCGHDRCPCTGGSKGSTWGRRQYRSCSRCGHVFRTIVPHKIEANPIGSEERLDP